MNIQKQISDYNHYQNNEIKYIVIHDTGNYKDTAKANATYFAGGNRGASAHYFVDSCSIYQSVEDCNGAWHCGDGRGVYGITNTNSIGIEMCNSGGYISEQTIINTIALTLEIMNKYNISPNYVVRHYDASRKICPNNMSANGWQNWKQFKEKINDMDYSWEKENNSSNENQNNELYDRRQYVGDRALELQQKLNIVGVYGLVEDGNFGENTYKALIDFQNKYGLTIDGYAGTNTFNKLNELMYGNSLDKWNVALQEELNVQGFKDENGNVLLVDGKPGKLTLSACPVIRIGDSGNITKLVQKKLNQLGYDCGIADGAFGSKTQRAVIEFQRANGLGEDAIIGKMTWSVLVNA